MCTKDSFAETKRPGCEADNLPRSTAMIKNAWIYTSHSSIYSHFYTGTSLPYHSPDCWQLDVKRCTDGGSVFPLTSWGSGREQFILDRESTV